jgi:cysteine desulfurase
VDRPGAYLDHGAAAPLDPRVRAAMRPFLEEEFGSPEGLHEWARVPAEALERARGHVAALAGAHEEAVIFTGGDTEARNLAVKGLLSANRNLGRHVVATAVEHPATLAACRTATRHGGELTLVGVDERGVVAPADLAAAVRPDTALLTLPHGQPEIGTLQDVPLLVEAVRATGSAARVHVDAGATAGLVPVDVAAFGCDALTLGGRTMAGPGWVGALVVRPGARIHPLVEGGAQEGGKRAGAVDLAGIVGLGEAARIAALEMDQRAARMRALADRLIEGLLAVPDVRLNGPRAGRVPGHVQVSAGWVDGEALVLALAEAGVAASPGSACSADARKAAPVLEAIGLEPPWTHSAVLFTLGPATSEAEVDLAAAAFAEAVARLRALSPIAP